MSRLLYIQASPRRERSYSNAAADAFLAAYRQANPGDEVAAINVFDRDLPRFDGLTLQAKYAILHGKVHTHEEREAWRAVEAVIEEFRSADKYLLSTPMWNFNIPYRLKHYIDVIVQPGYTFKVTEEGAYEGLVQGRPLAILASRGGAYAEGTGGEAYDHQIGYLRTLFGLIGFRDPKVLLVEPTLTAGPEAAGKAREASLARARELGASF